MSLWLFNGVVVTLNYFLKETWVRIPVDLRQQTLLSNKEKALKSYLDIYDISLCFYKGLGPSYIRIQCTIITSILKNTKYKSEEQLGSIKKFFCFVFFKYFFGV